MGFPKRISQQRPPNLPDCILVCRNVGCAPETLIAFGTPERHHTFARGIGSWVRSRMFWLRFEKTQTKKPFVRPYNQRRLINLLHSQRLLQPMSQDNQPASKALAVPNPKPKPKAEAKPNPKGDSPKGKAKPIPNQRFRACTTQRVPVIVAINARFFTGRQQQVRPRQSQKPHPRQSLPRPVGRLLLQSSLTA